MQERQRQEEINNNSVKPLLRDKEWIMIMNTSEFTEALSKSQLDFSAIALVHNHWLISTWHHHDSSMTLPVSHK
jgi:hypothetical protein